MMPNSIDSGSTRAGSEKDNIQQTVLPRDTFGGQDDNLTFFGINGLLKRKPSLAFCQEVVQMNKEELDPAEVRKVERKIDRLIIPSLLICYGFYYIDKTTLSYGAIFNIKKGLHLQAEEYNWLSSLFYIGWLGWALPTNLLMQKFPLGKYLAVNIFLWGALLMAQAASRNFMDIAILRVFSGAFEATADPAFILITSMWYTRRQQPTIIGYWYSANGIGIAVGGLLGYGIGNIKGALPSWRYEFLIVGALCSGWAVVLWFMIPDSPSSCTHRFTRRESVIVVSRKRHDLADAEKRQFNPQQALETFKDPKFYLFFLLGFFANVPNGGTSNFGTLVIQGFGFTPLQTTLMQVKLSLLYQAQHSILFSKPVHTKIPYGAFIATVIFVTIYVNRKLPKNFQTIVMCIVTVPTILGFALVAWLPQHLKIGRLIGYYLTGASNAVFVLVLSFVSGNVGGATKKSLCSASIFLGVATGNIVGPFLFKESEAPRYPTGIIGCMVSRILELATIIILGMMFATANKRRDQKLTEGYLEYNPNLTTGMEDLSDWENKAFRYVV